MTANINEYRQSKSAHIKSINKEIRQGYTNQSVYRLLDEITDLCFSATRYNDSSMMNVAYQLCLYARSLREFQKKTIAVPEIKHRAKQMFVVIDDWKRSEP